MREKVILMREKVIFMLKQKKKKIIVVPTYRELLHVRNHCRHCTYSNSFQPHRTSEVGTILASLYS